MKKKNILMNISVNKLHPHPDNPRKDIGDISELTESIKKNGIMQNLTVIPYDALEKAPDEQTDINKLTMSSEYYVLIGHRRLSAAKKAGIDSVPCKLITNISRNDQIAIMLEENIQRNDLTIYEQAQSFQLMLDLGETEDSLAKKTGFSKQTIRSRVELAKLDKDIFKEKSEDEGFQMTLKDINMLKKIEDVEARNEVLKSCETSGQLQWKVANKIKEIEKESNCKTIIKMLMEKGAKPAPESYQRERYSNKWNTVKTYSLGDEPPKRIQLPKSDEPYYFYKCFNYIEIAQKTKKVKKELTPEEMKIKARDAAKKELNAINKKLDEDIREFVTGIADGKYTISKTYESQLIKEVWGILTQFDYGSISISGMMCYISGKYSYDMTKEEKDQYRDKVCNLTMLQQMIICMGSNLKNNCEIVTYDCTCKENEAKHYRDAVNILEGYGFCIGEAERQLIDGTHELYGEGD